MAPNASIPAGQFVLNESSLVSVTKHVKTAIFAAWRDIGGAEFNALVGARTHGQETYAAER
jgi:hypothetical protein